MAKRYWVGGTNSWNNTSAWSTTSGGASGASVPTPTDDVYFDANSGTGTATCNYGLCNNFDATGCSTINFYFTDILQLYGNLTLDSTAGMTFSQLAQGDCFSLSGSTDQTLDCDGLDILELLGSIGTTRNVYLTSDIKCTANNFHVEGGVSVVITIIPSDGITITTQNEYFGDYTQFKNNTIEFSYGASSAYSWRFFDKRGIEGLNSCTIHLANADAGTYSVDMYFYDLLNGNYVFSALTVDSGITAEQLYTVFTEPHFEVGTFTLNGKFIAKNCDVGHLILNSGELAVSTVGTLRKVRIFKVTGSSGILGSYGENIYLPSGTISPAIAEVRGNVMTKTANVYPDANIKSVKTTATVSQDGKIVRTFNKLTGANYGAKNINTVTREGTISVSVSSSELKAMRDDITKYNKVEIIEQTSANPKGIIVFSGLILRHTYDYVKKELTLYLASRGYLFQRRLLEDSLLPITGLTSFSTTFSGTTRNGLPAAFEPNDYCIGPVAVGATSNLKAIEFNLLVADGVGDFTLELYATLADAIAGSSLLASTDTLIPQVEDLGIGARFLFSEAVSVTSGVTYYVKIVSTNTYWNITGGIESGGNGPTYNYDSTGSVNETLNIFLDYYTYADVADTTVTANGDSYIKFVEVLEKAKLRGLTVPTNILYLKPPEFDINYTFNTNTIAEVIDKFLEASTEDTYYYYDDAQDLLVFKQASSTPEVSLPYQKLTSLEMDIDAKNITNEVFFTGGKIGDYNLYQKYINATSKQDVGQTLQSRISDNRVTLSATASRLSNRFLNKNATVEYNATATLAKKDFLPLGIEIGTTLVITGIKGGDYPSLYDVAVFDQSRFDFDTTDAGTNVFTVASIDDSDPYQVKMQLGTLAPSLFSDVTYANQKITLGETANNDTAPA